VNEDRHLTTCLLLKGWRVNFVGDVLTATETPHTLRRWIVQQVRWGRAVHIETFHRPQVYLLHNPILFFAAIRRELGTFTIVTSSLQYAITGRSWFALSTVDILLRTLLILVYVILRNPYRASFQAWLWLIPGQILYNAATPAIWLWSAVTVLDDAWGTTMRSRGEMSLRARLSTKIYELGFFVVWMGTLGAAAGRLLTTILHLSSPESYVLVSAPAIILWIAFTWWLVATKG
jgi:hyaluronan synthase